MEPNRIQQTTPARGEYQPSPDIQPDVYEVKPWVRMALAAAIPMIGGAATMVTIPWLQGALALVGLGLSGVAAYLGMRVGSHK